MDGVKGVEHIEAVSSDDGDHGASSSVSALLQISAD